MTQRSPVPRTFSLTLQFVLPMFLITGCDVTLHVGRVGSGPPGSSSGDGGPEAGGTGGSYIASSDASTTPPVHDIPTRHPALTSTSKLDLVFMVDDSLSMAPLQSKMRAKMGDFMNVLKSIPGGLPDLHLAVVSSSLGAGVFGDVSGCKPGTEGNVSGLFQHPAGCTQLPADQSFLISTVNPGGGRAENFTGGDIASVLACIADLGDGGCGFEHQFESVRVALQRALLPTDENSGFLRSDATLAIVMLTNEDDCSVPEDSTLFDPSQLSVNQPLGGLQSYRCNEFGHLCGGTQPPHGVAGLPVSLDNCVSNENGPLISVGGFVDFLYGLKPGHPERIFVAAIAGPPTPYVVTANTFAVGSGEELQPSIAHSCTSAADSTQYADPAVRLRQWLDAFGPNSYFASICEDDFGPVMQRIATSMVGP